MSSPRIRSAVLALFLGGPVLAVTIICAILLATAGAGLAFLGFWAIARFFEYLNLSGREFQSRLEGQ